MDEGGTRSRIFGCCSSWVHCSIVGFCVSEEEDDFLNCRLARNMFVEQIPGWAETWRECALRALERDPNYPWNAALLKAAAGEYGTFPNGRPVVDPALAERSKKLAQQERERIAQFPVNQGLGFKRPPSSTLTATPVKLQPTTKFICTVRGLSVLLSSKGEIELKGAKVIHVGKNFVLVSWTYKDLVHYGILTADKQALVETLSPTKKLKGWDLRAKAFEVLQEYEANGIPPDKRLTVSIVQDAGDICEGHIFVWPKRDGYAFNKVYREGEHLYFTVDPKGDVGFVPKAGLQERLQSKQLWVVEESALPEGVTFPDVER